ncbi:MAG TPA: cupin domain-containing protein [Candidatus Hydrogenedentes bacterium]|nr:cupin domain-containing protein [Candidatus Hydrogenedentota bacterium]
MKQPFIIRNRGDVSPVKCPCGDAWRVLTRDDPTPVGVHFVSIQGSAGVHYHKATTEIYVVLAGDGEIELDGKRHPIRPGDVILIPPEMRHAAHGQLSIMNIVYPPFDPADEHRDE